jgi:outer membrane murein-binding lipoprotein Lpp
MKRIVLVGITLLLLALFAGCGGVSQEDYDAAVAERDDAQAQIATLQSQLDVLEDDLDAANEEVADLEALEAEIEAAAEEATKPATYTNSDYGFSVEYPRDWAEKTSGLASGVVTRIGEGVYCIPAVRIIVRDEAEGATLEEVFTAHLAEDGEKTIDTFTASDVTINGTELTQAEVVYSGGYGAYESLIVGLVKDGKWIIIEVYTLSSYPFSDESIKTEIINSVTFE